MIIILTILTFVIFFSLTLIKYQIEKRKKANRYDLEDYKMALCFSSMFFIMFFIPLLCTLATHINEYNKHYFKEKDEAELFILKNNVFTGTVVKWWTKDYPKIK